MVAANGGGFGRMSRARSTPCRIRSVDAVRPLEIFAQHDDRCQFLRRGFVCDSVASVASGQQLDGRSLVVEWVAASSSPFACTCRHDGSCLIAWRIDAIQTTVNTTCLCDVARARKYGMFCTRASLVTNSTFTTLMQAQFQAAALYFFRELERVRAAAERLRVSAYVQGYSTV